MGRKKKVIPLPLPADDNGCWIWPFQIDRDGYGKYGSGSAHRWTYTQVVGPIPTGLELDHLCRVRACVNPAHLEPVTHLENMRRRSALITHCKRGQEFTPENTYLVTHGVPRRCCRACNRAAAAASRSRRAEVRAS